jgi:Ala-tRNA(Pro) deacylase
MTLTKSNDILVAEKRYQNLLDFIDQRGVRFRCLEHPPCRSSEESAAARAAAGVPDSVGAKALIVRAAAPPSFIMAVLPGTHRLQSDKLRAIIGRFRFAQPYEIAEVTGGLEPGMIPPFAAPIFPALAQLVVEESIFGLPTIGFNAAHFQRSVVMAGEHYARLVPDATVAQISKEKFS